MVAGVRRLLPLIINSVSPIALLNNCLNTGFRFPWTPAKAVQVGPWCSLSMDGGRTQWGHHSMNGRCTDYFLFVPSSVLSPAARLVRLVPARQRCPQVKGYSGTWEKASGRFPCGPAQHGSRVGTLPCRQPWLYPSGLLKAIPCLCQALCCPTPQSCLGKTVHTPCPHLQPGPLPMGTRSKQLPHLCLAGDLCFFSRCLCVRAWEEYWCALRTFLIAPCTWEHGADERGRGLPFNLNLEEAHIGEVRTRGGFSARYLSLQLRRMRRSPRGRPLTGDQAEEQSGGRECFVHTLGL